MHFLRSPSCGDGIKALLTLFDFQHPPITAGHWLMIVPLQSLGMVLLTPPTPGLPLKVMVTQSCRTLDPWTAPATPLRPSDLLLRCWISILFDLCSTREGGRAEETLWISLILGFFTDPAWTLSNFFCAAPDPEECSPSEVSYFIYLCIYRDSQSLTKI